MTSPMKRILVLISGNGSNLQTLLDHCASGKVAGEGRHQQEKQQRQHVFFALDAERKIGRDKQEVIRQK